jgi:hypothetical protein
VTRGEEDVDGLAAAGDVEVGASTAEGFVTVGVVAG